MREWSETCAGMGLPVARVLIGDVVGGVKWFRAMDESFEMMGSDVCSVGQDSSRYHGEKISRYRTSPPRTGSWLADRNAIAAGDFAVSGNAP